MREVSVPNSSWKEIGGVECWRRSSAKGTELTADLVEIKQCFLRTGSLAFIALAEMGWPRVMYQNHGRRELASRFQPRAISSASSVPWKGLAPSARFKRTALERILFVPDLRQSLLVGDPVR